MLWDAVYGSERWDTELTLMWLDTSHGVHTVDWTVFPIRRVREEAMRRLCNWFARCQ
jgi:hypothetical protein